MPVLPFFPAWENRISHSLTYQPKPPTRCNLKDDPMSVAATPTAANPALGVTLMVAAMLTVPVTDVIAKLVGQAGTPVVQVAWARFFFQALLLLPIVLISVNAHGRRVPLWPQRPLMVAARGLFIAMATCFFFAALQVMPMAETAAIFFVEPLILTLLSALVLGETIGWRRVLAVVTGFGGAMLIVQPGTEAIGLAALLPLGAALCFALYLLLTKILADSENALTLNLWAGMVGCLVLSALLVLGWATGVDGLTPVSSTPMEWALLVALGVIATGGHFLIVYAFRHAPAAVLAPLQYLEIVGAVTLGYWVFGDFPEPLTWAGVAVIVGSGMFVFWRENVRRSEVSTAG